MTAIFGFVVLFLCSFVVAVGIAGGGVGVGGIFELACCFNFSISSRSVFAVSSQMVM